MLFKNLSDCINQSLRKMCISTQYNVTVSRFGLSRSLQISLTLISCSTQGPLSHMAVIHRHDLMSFFARRRPKEIISELC